MSATPRSAAANQANAQFSTGPRTARGKSYSARNSLSHGLASRQLIILPDEKEEFDELLADYQSQLDPQGAIEIEAFTQLIHAAWNARRARCLLAALGPTGVDPFTDPKLLPTAERYLNYSYRAESSFHRAFRRLDLLRKERLAAAENSPVAERTQNPPVFATEPADPPAPTSALPNEPNSNHLRSSASIGGQTPVRSTKIGRNQPCPCGSRLKYKRCCGK